MQLSLVKFEGNGPFYLRAVQSAKASGLGQTVQLTLYAQTDESGPKLVQIETQMTPGAAQELAGYLLRAARASYENSERVIGVAR